MKCILIYYTGTYNTKYLTELLKARLDAAGVDTEMYQIDPTKSEKLDLTGYDFIGLGYPIYGFNAPMAFVRFIKQQTFPASAKVFIYKNSGETYSANNASSISTRNHVLRCGAAVSNEYHFMMPYNIHFRFEDRLVREMLEMDNKLLDILVYELLENIPNIQKYRMLHRLITFVVKLQYIGGPINSFFYSVDKTACTGCGLCIKECPVKNIYKDSKGRVRFRHKCLMCMRCTLHCPKDAINMGLFQSWKVNGRYNLSRIAKMPLPEPVITSETEGFFKCYIKSYEDINRRHEELFGN